MSYFDNIDGIKAKDTVLRQNIDGVKQLLGYDDIYGLEFDFDGDTALGTRLCAAKGLYAGEDFDSLMGMRKCCLADDGTVNAYYGENGYAEDGSAGQVMVEIPIKYYRMLPLSLEKQTPESQTDTNRLGYHIKKGQWYVSNNPVIGLKPHPAFAVGGKVVDKIYISAYEGSIYDTSESAYLINDEQIADFNTDKLCSIANVQPCSGLSQNLTRANLNKLATNRGAGWYGLNIQTTSLLQLLYAIEYSSFNWQATLGVGITGITDDSTKNCASLTGSTSSLGNTSGRASSTVDYTGTAQTAEAKVSVSYRSVENFFSNIYKCIYGANIYGNGTNGGGIPYICSDYNFVDNKITDNYENSEFTVTNSSGYAKYFGYGSDKYDWLFMTSKTGAGANATKPIGDSAYVSENLNGYRTTCFGGYWNNGHYAGGVYWYLINSSGNFRRNVGGRLMYVPQ